MQISPIGVALLKEYEGFSAKIYLCPAGKATIGYGHVILANEKFPPNGISPSEAEKLLMQDAKIATDAINSLVVCELAQNQFDALASLTYNIGAKAFAKSKLLRLLNENNYTDAAAEFPKWIFSGGVKLAGLVRRRRAEQQLFMA